MRFEPSDSLSEGQIKKGLDLIIKDGLAAEVMVTMTGGAFLVALALKLGASNFQLGLLAALPTASSIFELLGTILVQKFGNRKAITVISSILGRGPLLLIALLPFFFSPSVSIYILIFLLFLHYFFGSISGCSWNSWMKDLVPPSMLGRYYANRTRMIQILSVVLSFAIAFILDYVKADYPRYELSTYSLMFFIGGGLGLYGIVLLGRTPEPRMIAVKANLLDLFKKPLKDVNFRNLILFNSLWTFAISMAAPFFSVYLLKVLDLPLSYVVTFNIISQVTNILFIRVWGRFSDQYSNKSILRICAPIYLLCILTWTFTSMPGKHMFTIPLLVLIYIFNGISTAGIHLSLANIGIKLAPKEGDAIVYLTTRAVIVATFAGIAPLFGGLFADYFSTVHLSWNLEWQSPAGKSILYLMNLHSWDFFFVFSFIFGLFSLYRLSFIKEDGEATKGVVMRGVIAELRSAITFQAITTAIKYMIFAPLNFLHIMRRKRRIERYRRKKRRAQIYLLRQMEAHSIPRRKLRKAG